MLTVIGGVSTSHAFSPVGFVSRSPSFRNSFESSSEMQSTTALFFGTGDGNASEESTSFLERVGKSVGAAVLASTLLVNAIASSPVTPSSSLSFGPPPASATDGAAIAGCLFQKCPVPLAKCVANPKCLANVICINTCNGKEDETGCQIKCGDVFENDVVGEFNKCALSDMNCVPQKPDDNSYPVPASETLVSKFDTSLFNGRWYITAGQNKLFDIFPCQVHFFTESGPGKFFGKLNWRVEEPDGEFFNRDAVQRFVQDPKQPGHLINHDNEYLHYEDDWYVLDYAPDNDPDGTPAFALIYYRGSNDAWIGYGGAVVYTREAKLPTSLLPRLREGVKKVGFDFDRDFDITDNSCKVLSGEETTLLREKFAGKVALQTEEQLRAQAVRVRGNAANGVKAQAIYIEGEIDKAENAVGSLVQKTEEFEREIVGDIGKIEQKTEALEREIVTDIEKIEKTVLKR